jgi:hypothetical protein
MGKLATSTKAKTQQKFPRIVHPPISNADAQSLAPKELQSKVDFRGSSLWP